MLIKATQKLSSRPLEQSSRTRRFQIKVDVAASLASVPQIGHGHSEGSGSCPTNLRCSAVYTNTRSAVDFNRIPQNRSKTRCSPMRVQLRPTNTAHKTLVLILQSPATCKHIPILRVSHCLRQTGACSVSITAGAHQIATCVYPGQEEKMKNELQQEQVRYQQDGLESTTGRCMLPVRSSPVWLMLLMLHQREI